MASFDVPILLITYKRLDTTQKVLERIAQIKPSLLYVSSNAPDPAKPDDNEKVLAVRSMIEKRIDWPCNVKKLYRTDHVGAGVSISSAISWFFENVEEGIILEDDTLPAISFFNYCKLLLDKYRNEQKIKIIGGSNYSNREIECKSTYYFTAFPHIWGWATWKRTWSEYDFTLNSIRDDEVRDLLKKYFTRNEVIDSWVNSYNMVKDGKTFPWDFQLGFSIFKNAGINIVSAKNLVSNIGFGLEATNTKNTEDELSNATLTEVTGMIHPEKIEINKVQDRYTEMKVAESLKPRTNVKRLISKVVNMITGK